MNDPQIWTLIGVFAAGLFGLLGLISTQWTRTMRAEFAAVGYRFDALDSKLSGRIDAVESRLESRIDSVETRLTAKIELLARDITAITRRVFPDDS